MLRFIFCGLLLIGCGHGDKETVYGDSPDPKADGDLQAKFEKIRGIVKASCLTSGCHADGKIVDLRTAEKFKSSNSKARVGNGSMPPPQSGPGKAFSAKDKAAINSFYNN